MVKRNDEGRAVTHYCLDPHAGLLDPAWNLYPNSLLLAAIDIYQQVLGTSPGPAGRGAER